MYIKTKRISCFPFQCSSQTSKKKKKKPPSFSFSLGFPYTIAHRKDGTFTPPFPCLGHHLGRPNRKAPFRGFFVPPPPKKKKALENVKNMQKPTYIMVVEVQSFCFREVFFFLLNSVFFLVCICFRVCLMMVSDLSSFHVVFIS